MLGQALEPRQLVGEFRAGLRVAVGRIEAADDEAVHRDFDVAALRVGIVTRQLRARDHRLPVASQNGDAVPRFLPAPDRAVAGFLNGCGNSASLALSSCRQTMSGLVFRSHLSRFGRRRLMLLILNVAIFMRSFYTAAASHTGAARVPQPFSPRARRPM